MSSKTKCWLWMLLVILSETSATSTLKMFGSSEGGSKMLLLGLLIALYCTCYYSLSRAVKDIPVGLAYATWSGTGGILVVSTLGMAFYGQHPDTAAIIGMAVIASGIIIMNLFSKMGSEASEEDAPAAPAAAMDKNIAN
ncbi:TPA: multidrug efflux SMR transporter [Klebsiella pneumoniae]|nr:multidrug efflux SMR transporter [Klebsiella pneumoniae]